MGCFWMNDTLYHGANTGAPRENHKYIRREWKNGRWVYYYGEAQTVGQNYRTADEIERDRKLNEQLNALPRKMLERRSRGWTKLASKADSSLTQTANKLRPYVENGNKFMNKVDRLLHTRVVDLPIVIGRIRRGEDF